MRKQNVDDGLHDNYYLGQVGSGGAAFAGARYQRVVPCSYSAVKEEPGPSENKLSEAVVEWRETLTLENISNKL